MQRVAVQKKSKPKSDADNLDPWNSANITNQILNRDKASMPALINGCEVI